MYSIMLVDDERIILESLMSSIDWHRLGMFVLDTASNGQEALEKAEQLNPDIIMTDVRMPIMDGLEMAQHVKARNPEIVFVFLSGYSDFKYIKAALCVEAADYLLKPVEKDELASVMIRVKKKCDAIKASTMGNGKAETKPASVEIVIPGEADYVGNAVNLQRVREIIAIILNSYCDEQFTVEDAAAKLYLTTNYVRSIFKEVTGDTFLEYLTRLRMDRATVLLEDKAIKIHEVAAKVGYRNVSHFCSLFAKYKGDTPNEFRKKNFL